MHAQEVTFIQLVQGEKQFQVPLYQRPYSWGQPQLQQLWNDLVDQGEALTADPRRSGHFLGSVVLAPSPSLSAGGLQRWLVVDGQQRMTTLMLALVAIRDHVRDVEEELARRIGDQYLTNTYRQGDERLRLLPTQADRDTFRSLVMTPDAPREPSGIADAYTFFRRQLTDADEPGATNAARMVEVAISAGLSIVEITAQPGDNVHRIFESLNNTGLRLSQADLLRNYLFMRLPTRGEDVYRDVWLPMQEDLTSRELELLVWLTRVVDDERVKQSDIYRVEQARLEAIPAHDEAAVEREVTELARRSRHLICILRPEREEDAALRQQLRHLQAWGAQTAYPLLMHLLDLRERGRATSDQVVQAVRCIDSFVVRRMVCGVATNNLNRVFNAAPSHVPGDDVAVEVHRYLSGRRRYWPTDRELAQAARHRPFYWSGRGPQRVAVLRRLEESYQASEQVDFAASALTIEHVLPQTATQEWLDQLAGEVTDEAGPGELHGALVHTLGNLTLTGENSRLSNNPFQRKQDLLDASTLRMNREIAEAPRWGKQQILDRADRLATRMQRIWPGPLDGVPDDDAEGRDWSVLRRACAALPAGSWTTYSDLAELIGSHAVPVGHHIATREVPHAWRVLTAAGRVASQFRWLQPGRDDDPVELLRGEGVRIDEDGVADAAQRVSAQELAELLGMDVEDAPVDAGSPIARRARFFELLDDAHPAAAAGVSALLSSWSDLGGSPTFGHNDETSCFLTIDSPVRGGTQVWPFALYPRSGSVEVVFQHLSSRSVFADPEVRRAFRDRLALADVQIPDAKLSLRPSFRLSVLEDDGRRASVVDALRWFVETFRTAEVEEAPL